MCRPLLLHTVPQRNRNDPFYRVGKCWYIQRDLKTGNKKKNNSHAAAWVLRLVTSCFKYRRMIVIISMCRKHLGNSLIIQCNASQNTCKLSPVAFFCVAWHCLTQALCGMVSSISTTNLKKDTFFNAFIMKMSAVN